MDLMSRITKGAAGAALCGSTGASMGGAGVGGITAIGGTVFGPAGTFFCATVGTGVGASVGGAIGSIAGFCCGFFSE